MNKTQQIAYLKHVGALNNVKVTIECLDGKYLVHIHDYTFTTFENALYYLQKDAGTIVRDDKQDMEAI